MGKNAKRYDDYLYDAVLKGKVDITPPKKTDKNLVDVLDSDKDDKKKIEKLSPKVFDVLAGLLGGHLFGIVGDFDEGNDDAKRNADRYLGENSQKKLFKGDLPDYKTVINIMKAQDLASFAPVGDGCKTKNVMTNNWEDCDKEKTPPKKRFRIYDTGRSKSRKTSGRVRGANQGKRGTKVKV